VLIATDSGAAANEIRARPLPVVTAAVAAVRSVATADRGGGDKAAQAPDPTADPRYRTHGRSKVISVGPSSGLAISNVPSTEEARFANPARPVPRAGRTRNLNRRNRLQRQLIAPAGRSA